MTGYYYFLENFDSEGKEEQENIYKYLNYVLSYIGILDPMDVHVEQVHMWHDLDREEGSFWINLGRKVMLEDLLKGTIDVFYNDYLELANKAFEKAGDSYPWSGFLTWDDDGVDDYKRPYTKKELLEDIEWVYIESDVLELTFNRKSND
jgi:hypothetical protein